MEAEQKIFKYFFIGILIAQGITATLMIASLSVDQWVYSENSLVIVDTDTTNENNYFKGSEFKGSLSFCFDGCHGTYAGLANKWCDKYNEIQDMSGDQEFLSVCKMFKNLNFGMLAFAALDVLSLIGLMVWLVGIACCIDHSCYFKMNYCCSVWVTFSHIIGLIAYNGLSNSRFSDNCDKTPDNGGTPELCASHGPRIALFVAFLIPIITITYCIVACRYYRVKINMQIAETRSRQPIHMVQAVPAPLILPQVNNLHNPYDLNQKPEELALDPACILYPPAVIVDDNQNGRSGIGFINEELHTEEQK